MYDVRIYEVEIKNNYQENVMFNSNELERYDRNFCINEIGTEGQIKLKKAKILVIGAGGLGSPALMYLASAGVGTIGIVDDDDVSLSNLNRQIAHNTKRINLNKAISAKETLSSINPEIKIIAYPIHLTENNIEELINQYDFVLDCVDNFETKFLINDACVKAQKPFSYGGVLGFEGQTLTYNPNQGPCFRCIFEDIPSPDEVKTAAEVGILGAIAGVIGSIQALEAIKYIIGNGNLLEGRIFIFDGLNLQTRIAKLPKATPGCICTP
ncbi:MAG: HesA/MoeB/ThiF family protein [Lachnospiraceae bacterium]|nr:HesA/MoeB/ThiF family protein [Lachnospiraceae bacterium]